MTKVYSFLVELLVSKIGKKAIKYTVGSGISAVASQVVFMTSFGIFHWFSAHGSSILATLAGAIPSYFLNRRWAWQRKTRSSFSKEVLPYLAMAVIGLVWSTFATDYANSHSGIVGGSNTLKVLFVSGAYFGAFAILWVAKFAFLNKVLFASRPADDDIDEDSFFSDEAIALEFD